MFAQNHLQDCIIEDVNQASTPLYCFTEKKFKEWLPKQNQQIKQWLKSQDFSAKKGQVASVPDDKGALAFVVCGLDEEGSAKSIGQIVPLLKPAIYRLEHSDTNWLAKAVIAWVKAAYRFTKFDENKKQAVQLLWPEKVDKDELSTKLNAIFWIRDMINDPTETFSTPQLTKQMASLAKHFNAEFSSFVGEELLANNYPLVHAVGRAGANAPRFSILTWGNQENPTLCLVGKGVCYDTGGLSMKSTDGMLQMKKDMGGAAHVLGLAYLIMAFDLPVHLKVFVPAVENAVAGHSYRPGDVFIARNGVSVEITNTDAEGRLVMADALAQAAETHPDLIIDFSTLTGAARVALGPDISAAMSQPAHIADDLQRLSPEHDDPVATLPLYEPYRQYLKSNIAQTTNSASQPYGGAIIAGLFLKLFVGEHHWVHFDIPGWNTDSTAGGPGGEAMGLLSMWAWLQQKYC